MGLKMFTYACTHIGNNGFLCFGNAGWSGKGNNELNICVRLLDSLTKTGDSKLKISTHKLS